MSGVPGRGPRKTGVAVQRRRARRAALLATGAAVVALTAAVPATSSDGRAPHDFVVGSASNQFLVVIGEARLSVSAHRDEHGRPTGHVRAKGDPDGPGPLAPFTLEGEVTCLEVRGNRAAVKYRFKHADGSAAPFQGGGVQIFIEDNGPPKGGESRDKTAFDPPQPASVFRLDESRCDDPNLRPAYDKIESGNFVVNDATF